MARGPFAGVLAPVLTPFNADLSVDSARFVGFAKDLLGHGCSALVPFGTTSEATSLSLDERLELLTALREAEVPGHKLLPGVGLPNLPETVRLTRAAVNHGCGGVLLPPPFFYKNVSDAGLYDFVRELIQRVGDDRLRLYLYHIPGQAGIGWSPALVERLFTDFPETVVGLKDSGGDWSYTRDLLHKHPGFSVFVGNEHYLRDALELRGAGTITASANVNPHLLNRLYECWGRSGGDELNEAVIAYRKALEAFPTIAGAKAVVARRTGHPGWTRVRPPLTSLPAEQANALLQKLNALEAFTAGAGRALGGR
ncbi:dihydrodipicolinate synthase family protein [Rhodovibrio salinarum]|uniref:Dihydrodipicolinate synthase family protein n=1 Tax=Rhodovibrio salinarum TaxID=1087 RepID=A0A934QKN3_9PROT|nr:dihydrodipicolinate synthase family protein [Rhodovibrio salinarum]MBK1698614.1 dihydrodipicolinate synthase family protein [Rhodovibrio salinarum]